ncbi:MAG: hypothetical protein HRU15_03390 [Planctomycetes bacterium]|nr:hypothetical protein [Planctomycetota bacterium]
MQRHHSAEINKVLANEQQEYLRTVEKLFSQAQQRIWIMMYVVRRYDQKQHSINILCQALADAAQRKIDVRVVLDHSDPTAKYPGPDNSEVVQWLSKNGVTVIYDELERTTHAKIVLCDQQAIIGSHNWTGYAVSKNREISVLSSDVGIVGDIEKVFMDIPGFSTSR